MLQLKNESPIIECALPAAVGLSEGLIKQLGKALDSAEDAGDGALLLIRLQGVSNQAVIQEWPGAVTTSLVNKWEREVRRLERSRATTLVFMTGSCSALALEVLLAVDCRVADPGMSLQCQDAGRHHAWPGMALFRLVQHLGLAAARQLLQHTVPLTAAQCRERLVVDQLLEQDHATASELIAAGGLARGGEVPTLRRLMLDGTRTSYDDALGLHLAACDRILRRAGSAEEMLRNDPARQQPGGARPFPVSSSIIMNGSNSRP